MTTRKGIRITPSQLLMIVRIQNAEFLYDENITLNHHSITRTLENKKLIVSTLDEEGHKYWTLTEAAKKFMENKTNGPQTKS